jgi:hypothetical protein
LTAAKEFWHSLVIVNHKRTSLYMPRFEPDSGKDKNPATLEDYQVVRTGKATPEQIAKVRDALSNKYSPLRLELGDDGPMARFQVERKYAKPAPYNSPALRNFHSVMDYLSAKRDAGVLSQEEVNIIMKLSEADHLKDVSSTPSVYAMYVTRTMKAIIKLRPELASEVKNLPISRKR